MRPSLLHFPAFVAFGMVLSLSACKTDDVGYYEQPLTTTHAGSSSADTAPEGATENTPTLFPYRIEDLAPSQRPALATDEAGIWLAMDKVETGVKTTGNRIMDPELNAYVRSVACRVAASHCVDIRPYVLRIPYFNATMYPNGMMHVWSGLLLRVRNEAQLAAILGHEAGHYLRRHSLQHYREIIDASNGLSFLSVGLGAMGLPHEIGNIAAMVASGSIAAFSRNHEREADGYGLVLLNEAGYDPREAWRVWDRVMKERAAREDEPETDLFLASHPQTQERMETLKRLGSKIRRPEAEDLGQDRYLAAILPHRADFLRDELSLRQFKSFEALLDMLIEDGANLAELHFFKGEIYRLRNGDGDPAKALAAYEKAKMLPGTIPVEVDLVYRRLDRNGDATEAFRRYLDRNPDAPDRLFLEQIIGAGV